jgi:conjugal transfer pilus assembly protein TraW
MAAPASARDYGQQGTVFPVIERDLLEQIHARLTPSGEVRRDGGSMRS